MGAWAETAYVGPDMWDLWLTLRGMWFRRGVSLAVLVVAALVVGGAVTGPLFLRAAGESVLHDTLNQALPIGRIVSDRMSSPVKARPLAQVAKASRHKLAALPTLDRLFTPPVSSLQVQAVVGRPGVTGASAVLAYREGVCAHVRMVSGRCAEQPGSVMVSAKTADAVGWRTGQRLLANGRSVRVVGLYAPVDPKGDYWGTHPYFAALSGSGVAGDLGSTVDALFGPRATLLAQPGYVDATGAVDRHLKVAQLRVVDVPAVEKALLDYTDTGLGAARFRSVGVTDTAVGAVLIQATGITDKLVLPVVVVEVQLLVLCWLILFLVVANAAEARGQEVSLAKLRGAPAASTVAFGLLDTLLLVVLAVPIGLALAWAWVTAIAHLQLAPGTPVVLTPASGLAAAGAGAGAAVAAVLAASRTLRRPVLEQWRRATRRVKSRPWLVDGVLVAAVVAGLVVLTRHGAVQAGSTSVLALVVPGLVVLAAALLGSRALPGLCRAAFGSTRRNARLGGFLAVRQLARRPTTLRLALILTVAFGLVAFGIDAWSVARANEHDRAWTEVGAAEVLTVASPATKDLGKIVDRLDHSGRQAAAVAEITDYSRPTPITLLAVQPERFARVAFWRSDFGTAPLPELMRRLTQKVAPPVALSGTALEVRVHVSRLSAEHPPVLVADIAQQGAGLAPVTVGRLRPGDQTLRTSLPCVRGTCRLVGLHLERPGTSFYPIDGRLALTGIRVRAAAAGWHDLPADLSLPHGWRPTGAASSVVPPDGGGGLVLVAHAGSVANPGWRVADRPARLPALMTRTAHSAAGPHVGGLANTQLDLDPISVGPALPGAGADAVIVDRGYAIDAAHGYTLATTETVWLAPSAVATFPDQLRKAGVNILAAASAPHQTVLYQRQGPALAILLFLAGAGLGALLAAGGVVLNLHLAGRRRTYELAAMTALGVGRRVLLFSLFLEQALLLVFGIGVGVAAGIGGAMLALPAVPEFADTPTAPPMLYGVHLVSVLGTAAGAVVVLAIVIALSAANLLRGARFAQLREAPA